MPSDAASCDEVGPRGRGRARARARDDGAVHGAAVHRAAGRLQGLTFFSTQGGGGEVGICVF